MCIRDRWLSVPINESFRWFKIQIVYFLQLSLAQNLKHSVFWHPSGHTVTRKCFEWWKCNLRMENVTFGSINEFFRWFKIQIVFKLCFSTNNVCAKFQTFCVLASMWPHGVPKCVNFPKLKMGKSTEHKLQHSNTQNQFEKLTCCHPFLITAMARKMIFFF